jgi:predicted amidohydrolase
MCNYQQRNVYTGELLYVIVKFGLLICSTLFFPNLGQKKWAKRCFSWVRVQEILYPYYFLHKGILGLSQLDHGKNNYIKCSCFTVMRRQWDRNEIDYIIFVISVVIVVKKYVYMRLWRDIWQKQSVKLQCVFFCVGTIKTE